MRLTAHEKNLIYGRMSYVQFFQALADETRLCILSLLQREGEMTVGDMVKALGVPQSRVSRHLAVLRDAGLVQMRRDAQWVHYRVSEDLSDWQREVLAAFMRAQQRACQASDAPTLDRLSLNTSSNPS